MTNFVTCPACRGSGVVPVEQAAEVEQAAIERAAEQTRRWVAAFESALADRDLDRGDES